MASPAPEQTPATSSPPSNSTSSSTPPSTPTNSTSPPSPPPPSTNDTISTPPTTNATSPSAGTPTNGTIPAVVPPGPGGLPPGLLAALVMGVVIGAGIVLVGVAVVVCFYRRKKRRLAAQNLPLHAPKNDPSAGPLQSLQENTPSPTTYNGSMLPKPTAPPVLVSNSPVPPVAKASSSSGSLGSDKPFPSPSPGIPLGNMQSTFTYEELKMATDNFSEANLLGQGGFGYVHKGVLSNGEVVAIKQLKVGSGQGEREFQAEIGTINRVHHRHLVSLVGYCISGAQRLLVYEFVPNKTLEFHLYGKGRPVMNWPTRMKIALGSARGLAYLHEDCQPKIIHRDIKASNILIDDSFEAKVADFGLAKFSLDTDTHVSTRVMGTFGYLAPEYASSGKLTEKSDTFSFGVLLLELITGRRPFDKNDSFLDDSMVDWAMPLLAQGLEDGNFDTFVDPKLQEYDSTEMTRMVACAAACVRHSARRRPRMSQIVRVLEGNMPLEDLNDGVAPGHSRAFSNGSSEYSSSQQYKEDIKKFKKLALESVEHGSSGFSVVTSDGQNPSSSSTEGRQTTQEMELQKAEKDTNVTGESS